MTSPETSQSSFSERDFRDAMGSFATGVCVVSANNAYGEPIGMTVNSFSSVSLDPPLVLVCLGEDSPRSRAIINAGQFNISILSDTQMDVSSFFAQPGQGLADTAMIVHGLNTCPAMAGSAAVIECNVETQYPGGDHVILIGRVTHVAVDSDANPFLYFRGRYRTLADES